MKPNVPILIITYNRLAHLRQVLDALSSLHNPLYIFQDGSKGENDPTVADVRTFILQHADLFEKKRMLTHNLGCKKGVEAALSWAFVFTQELIILEDDIVIDPSFVSFATQLLERYADDNRVFMITATKQVASSSLPYDYFFSHHTAVWGWATWKHKWDMYQKTEQLLLSQDLQAQCTCIPNTVLKRAYSAVHGQIDTWDFIWEAALFLHGAYCVIPKENAATNVGFDTQATHTKRKTSLASLPTKPLSTTSIQHPPYINTNAQYEQQLQRKRKKVFLLIDAVRHLFTL